ncbi:MAG: hypothetical protein ACP5P1_04835 [Acidimicrobiales bacterium]
MPEPRRRGRAERESAQDRREVDPVDLPERGLIGEMRIEAGPAFGPTTRLRVRGLNVLAQAAVQEKEKVSLTLDKSLVEEIRAQFGGRALSASINELLYAALAQERLGELVEEMEQEAGTPSPEAYERVLAQWFAEG